MKPNKHVQSRGFSLIELLVVIAIVGIIAAIAAPAYKAYQDRTRFSAALRLLDPITDSMKSVYSKKGSFAIPVTQLGFTAGFSPSETVQPSTLSGFIAPPYLAAIVTQGNAASSGQCSFFSVTGQFTNFGDGNIFVNGLTEGKFMQLSKRFMDVNGILVPVCSYSIVQYPGSTAVHPNIPNCYDMQDPAQVSQYNNYVNSLHAQCP